MNLEEMKISAEELHTLARNHATWVTRCLADGNQSEWSPNMMVLTQYPPSRGLERGIEVLALMVPFNTAEEKCRALSDVGAMFARDQKLPLAVVFSSEAWMSRNPPAGMEPKDDAFRQEVVLVAAVDLQLRTCMTTAPITRVNERILPVEFGPLKTEGATFELLHNFYAGFAAAAVTTMKPRQPVPSAN